MGRNKGESYRKVKLKVIKRITCPNWSIGEDVIELVKDSSSKMGICQSRIVEVAIKNLLILENKKLTKLQNIFTKS